MQSNTFDDAITDIADHDIIEIRTRLPAVKSFDLEMLPDSLRDWTLDTHERIGCPIDYLAVGTIVSLASLIGRKVGVHPKRYDDWLVIPNLWGALIGEPSAKKSPALKESTAPLERLASTARERFKQAQKEAETSIFMQNATLEQAEKDVKKAIAKGQGIEESKMIYQELKSSCQDVEVVEKRYIVNDSTVEKLGELLNQNPNGLLVLRDELTGWIKTLDREDQANARAFYLEAFNGSGSYTYDRIMRGTIHIESMTVSVLGGIQPSKLFSYLQGAINGTSNDGFVQRLQLAVYPDIQCMPFVDRYPNTQAKNRAFDIYLRLDEMPERRHFDDFGNEQITGLRFDNDAQKMFNDWYKHNELIASSDETPTIIESHIIKYASLIPSLALVLELADNTEAQSISKRSLERALLWYDYLYSHAVRIYAMALSNPVNESAKLIIDRREKLPEVFKAKAVHDKNWSGLQEYADVKKALTLLVDHGYLIEMIDPSGGRPTSSFRWNKNLKHTGNDTPKTPIKSENTFLGVYGAITPSTSEKKNDIDLDDVYISDDGQVGLF